MPNQNPDNPGDGFPGNGGPWNPFTPGPIDLDADPFQPSFSPEDFESVLTINPESIGTNIRYSADLIQEFCEGGKVRQIKTLTIVDQSDSQTKWIEKKSQFEELKKTGSRGEDLNLISSTPTGIRLPSKEIPDAPNVQHGPLVLSNMPGYYGMGNMDFQIHLRLYLFVSPDGAKLLKAWKAAYPADDELFIFLENNAGDRLTDAVMLLKSGTGARKKVTGDALADWVNDTYTIPREEVVALVEAPVDDQSVFEMMMKNISTEVMDAGINVLDHVIKGIDWVFKKVEKDIKYQPKYWNPEEKDFTPAFLLYQNLKDENVSTAELMELLAKSGGSQIGVPVQVGSVVVGASLDAAESMVKKITRKFGEAELLLKQVLPKEGEAPSGIVQTTFFNLYQAISGVTKKVLAFLNGSIEDLQNLFEQGSLIINAFYCGFVNGFIDLINGIIFLLKLYFQGVKAQASFISQSEYYIRLSLEMMDNLITAVSNFDWTEFLVGLFFDIAELVLDSSLKGIEKLEKLSGAEWAYYIGYLVFNVVEMFIPYGAIVKGLEIGGKAGRVAGTFGDLFQGVAKVSKQAINQSIDLAKQAQKVAAKGLDLALDLLNKIIDLMGKGADELLKFFRRVFDRIKSKLDDVRVNRLLKRKEELLEQLKKHPPTQELKSKIIRQNRSFGKRIISSNDFPKIRKELQSISSELTILRESNPVSKKMLEKMDKMGDEAFFRPEPGFSDDFGINLDGPRVFLRRDCTYYTYAHEYAHAELWHYMNIERSDLSEIYRLLPERIEEEYALYKLMKNKNKWDISDLEGDLFRINEEFRRIENLPKVDLDYFRNWDLVNELKALL